MLFFKLQNKLITSIPRCFTNNKKKTKVEYKLFQLAKK